MPQVISLARVCRTFRLNPADVAADPDQFRWALLIAAHTIIAHDADSTPDVGPK